MPAQPRRGNSLLVDQAQLLDHELRVTRICLNLPTVIRGSNDPVQHLAFLLALYSEAKALGLDLVRLAELPLEPVKVGRKTG